MMSKPARVGLLAAVALAAGNMIGTGVFTSLGFQIAGLGTEQSGNVFPILLLWVAGALIAFCGAVSYAELAAAFPRSGGEYNLLGRAYSPMFGFLGGWVSLVVAFPAPIALAAIAFGKYGGGPLGLDESAQKLLAVGAIAALCLVHCFSIRLSSRTQTVLTAFKVLLILAFIVCGLTFSSPNSGSLTWLPSAADVKWLGGPGGFEQLSRWFDALTWVLYAYSGWNAVCYITGELENPKRTLPLAMMLAALGVGLLYTLLNAAFLRAAPVAGLSGVMEVGVIAAEPLFGMTGARFMSGLIAFGLLSALSAMVWAGSRVAQTMGQDYPALAPLRLTSKAGVPVPAVIFQGLLSCGMVFSANPDAIMNYTGFCLQLILLLTAWAVVHVRIRQPELERPYRAWGYPFTPILFCLFVCLNLAAIRARHPHESVYGMGVLLLGAAFYFYARAGQRSTGPSAPA